jgi:hypothetical protein
MGEARAAFRWSEAADSLAGSRELLAAAGIPFMVAGSFASTARVNLIDLASVWKW